MTQTQIGHNYKQEGTDMPIMAAHGRNDARSAAWLLANAASDCLSNPETAAEQEVALNNVYWLLEAFRSNVFFGLQPKIRQQRKGTAETITLMRPVERYVDEVRDALEKSIDASFENQPKDEAIQKIENVLRAVTYPQKFEEPSYDDKMKTVRFFEVLLEELQSE